jgi:hypothetical protein
MATMNSTSEKAKPSTTVKKGGSTRKAAVARKRRSTARSKQSARANGRSASSHTASQLLKQGRGALSGAYDQVASAGRAFPDMTRYVTDSRKRQSITHMIEERPLMVGAIGLGIGMVLAALMPSMRKSHDGGGRSQSRRRSA